MTDALALAGVYWGIDTPIGPKPDGRERSETTVAETYAC